MTKKKSRPALTNYRRNIKEMLDFDYTASLSNEHLDYLEKFAKEYYGAKFSPANNLHDTPEMRRKTYTSNNARQRDLWNRFFREWGDCNGAELTLEDEGEEKNG